MWSTTPGSYVFYNPPHISLFKPPVAAFSSFLASTYSPSLITTYIYALEVHIHMREREGRRERRRGKEAHGGKRERECAILPFWVSVTIYNIVLFSSIHFPACFIISFFSLQLNKNSTVLYVPCFHYPLIYWWTSRWIHFLALWVEQQYI